MEFEAFTQEVRKLLEKKLGEGVETGIHRELKNNGIQKTGILLKKEGERFWPVLYLEEAYRKYSEGMEMEEVLDDLADLCRRQAYDAELNEKFSPKSFGDYSHVREHLRLRLVNYEKNAELLADMPHIRWHDLAAVFHYEIEGRGNGNASVVIKNHHLTRWKEIPETLYRDALENMKNKAGENLFSLASLFAEAAASGMEETPPIYVLTNRTRQYGAAAMLYSGKMKELADTAGSDLVILPSSLHEVLLLPDCGGMHSRWEQMVREVNRTAVDPEEVLSDHIYRYSREKDAVELLEAG